MTQNDVKLHKPSSANPCQAHNRSGAACGAFALDGSRYCWTHDPANAEKRRQARSVGGKARHRRPVTWADDELRSSIRIRSVADILALLERAVYERTRVAQLSPERKAELTAQRRQRQKQWTPEQRQAAKERSRRYMAGRSEEKKAQQTEQKRLNEIRRRAKQAQS